MCETLSKIQQIIVSQHYSFCYFHPIHVVQASDLFLGAVGLWDEFRVYRSTLNPCGVMLALQIQGGNLGISEILGRD